jgi:hypothetical protein
VTALAALLAGDQARVGELLHVVGGAVRSHRQASPPSDAAISDMLEAGNGPGDAVRGWGHVRLFSAWPELVDAAAARLLRPSGWAEPAGYPTGAEWISS